MIPLVPSLARVAAILFLASGAGAIASAALVPPGRSFRLERIGWSFAAGLATTAVSVPLAFATGTRPGWGVAVVIGIATALLGWWRRLGSLPDAIAPVSSGRFRWVIALWSVPLVAGIVIYALRALTEPMWSNDFLAIWGLKGKMIFFEGLVPQRLLSDSSLGFSHPEYPLGLPFLYAGVAFLLRRWDDHAMALIFPALLVATLLVLMGWLRRRGASSTMAVGAAAILSLFEPLYSAAVTGYAEVPLSFFALLLATALSDAVDGTDSGALRRLALAGALCAGTKNEGLLFVLAAAGIGAVGLRLRGGRPLLLVGALIVPAAAVVGTQRLVFGNPPLRDFDLGLLRPSQWEALASRLGTTARLTAQEAMSSGTPIVLLFLLLLFLAGRRSRWAHRPLVLALCAEGVYLALPALAVYPGHPELGPALLVATALGRTSAALAPLVAAGLAGRLGAPVREILDAGPASAGS